ncbi:MAG: lipase family alpha/beta hydrolase [Dehalococcoidia bacterium]
MVYAQFISAKSSGDNGYGRQAMPITGVGRGSEAGYRWPATSSGAALLLEQQRASMELGQLLSSPVYYGIGVPYGDGSPIVLVPGFLGSDRYLAIMRAWLGRIGYRPHASGLQLTAGSPFALIARVLERADRVAAAEGRPVTLIGHSLGGMLSGVVAWLRPDIISHVVTLGSPRCNDPRSATNPIVARLADVLIREGRTADSLAAERLLEQQIFGGSLDERIRLTCFYTKSDAVVHWRACIDAAPRTVAYEVQGTHSGLAWNPQVYRQLARVLIN